MRIIVDDALLTDLGLAELSEPEKARFLRFFRERMESRIGATVAGGLTEAQLGEFETLAAARDEARALRWLADSVPHCREIVHQVFATLCAEVRVAAPSIVAADRLARDAPPPVRTPAP
jgi:hypothetical protein